MKQHEINSGSHKPKKRLGRGIGSGRGKTATRGTKGQNSRTGGGVKPGFEGGQTKFSMRLPKARGFTARNSIDYQIVTTDSFERLKLTKLDSVSMRQNGLISSSNKPVKLLLGLNKITKKITISVDKSSRSAIAAVEKAGGKVVLLDVSANSQKPEQTEKPKVTSSTKPKTSSPKKK